MQASLKDIEDVPDDPRSDHRRSAWFAVDVLEGPATLHHAKRVRWVKVGEMEYPKEFSVVFAPTGLDVTVRLDFTGEVDDIPTCEALTVRRASDMPVISSDTLRMLPVATLKRLALALAERKLHHASGEGVVDVRTRAVYRAKSVSGGQGRPLDADHFWSVAEVYRQAEALGEPPTKAVAIQLAGGAKNHSTAARWVGIARNTYHFLEPTSPGKRGG